MNADTFLTPGDKDLIRAAVQSAESKTSGEIRVLVVGRSTPRSFRWPLLIGATAASISFAFVHQASWGYPGPGEYLMSAGIGMIGVVAAFFLIPPTRSAKDRASWKRAEREFAHFKMENTKGSTGVLVMLSLYEHEAVVYGDKGIVEKVPHDTWKREVETIISGVKAGTPGAGIAKAVEDIGTMLAQHFPRRDDDVNELPDDVVTRR